MAATNSDMHAELEAQLYRQFRVNVGPPPSLGGSSSSPYTLGRGGTTTTTDVSRRVFRRTKSRPTVVARRGSTSGGSRGRKPLRRPASANLAGIRRRQRQQRRSYASLGSTGKRASSARRKQRKPRPAIATTSRLNGSSARRRRSAQPRRGLGLKQQHSASAHDIVASAGGTASREPFSLPKYTATSHKPHAFFPTTPRFGAHEVAAGAGGAAGGAGGWLPTDLCLSARRLEADDEVMGDRGDTFPQDMAALLTLDSTVAVGHLKSSLGKQVESKHRSSAVAVIGTATRGSVPAGGGGVAMAGGDTGPAAGPGAYNRQDGCIGVEPQLLSAHRTMPAASFPTSKRQIGDDGVYRSPGPIYHVQRASTASSAHRVAPRYSFPLSQRQAGGSSRRLTRGKSPGPIYNTSRASRRSTKLRHAPMFSFGTAPRFR